MLLGLEEILPGEFELSVLDVLGGNPIGLYITAFGEDESGELYVLAKSEVGPGPDESGMPTGVVFKIVAIPEPSTAALLLIGILGLLCLRYKRSRPEA